MRKLLLFSLIILLGLTPAFAQTKNAKRIIPFTGMDYVRIMVDADYKTAKSNTFKVVIKAISDGKILWQGPLVPTPVLNVDKQQLAFNIKNLKPTLWTPNRPFLYEITLQQLSGAKVVSSLKERA